MKQSMGRCENRRIGGREHAKCISLADDSKTNTSKSVVDMAESVFVPCRQQKRAAGRAGVQHALHFQCQDPNHHPQLEG